MRILGADSLTGKDTSINAIPVNVLKPLDLCIVKTTDPDVPAAVMFYDYIVDHGGEENLPYVVNPLDNQDENIQTGEVVGSSRWVLREIYTSKLSAGSIVTNTIVPEISGAPITVGDDLTIHDHGVTVDGQVTINSEWHEPPMIVNSTVMVENLNAQYLNGHGYEHLLLNDNNEVAIPNGVDELDVYMTHDMVSPPHYSVMIDICNIVDPDPSIYSFIITNKQQDHFTVRFSGIIDSENYTLHYFMIGEASPPIDPPIPSGGFPPSGSPSGSPSGGPPPSGV